MASFQLNKLAAALKGVNDTGAAFLQKCMDSNGQTAPADMDALRAALADAFVVLGGSGGEADDSEADQPRDQERSIDAKRASDARRRRKPVLAHDFNLNDIFGGARDDARSGEHDIGSIFGKPAKFGEG